MVPRYPTHIGRNDVPAALRWLRAHFAVYGEAPGGDALAVLLQLQDEPDKLMRLVDRELPKLERNPERSAVVYPLALVRNDVPGALRWVAEFVQTFGEHPCGEALTMLLRLQDEPDDLERKLVARNFLKARSPSSSK